MKLCYRKAEKNDALLLIDIYNSAFFDDFVHYGECPAYGKTKEQMELSIMNYPKRIIYYNDTAVGVISLRNDGDGCYYIGCFCIIPKYQGMGIGTKAFNDILSLLTDWKRISLITPSDKKQNIDFYSKKCGFNVGSAHMDGNVEVVNLYIESKI